MDSLPSVESCPVHPYSDSCSVLGPAELAAVPHCRLLPCNVQMREGDDQSLSSQMPLACLGFRGGKVLMREFSGAFSYQVTQPMGKLCLSLYSELILNRLNLGNACDLRVWHETNIVKSNGECRVMLSSQMIKLLDPLRVASSSRKFLSHCLSRAVSTDSGSCTYLQTSRLPFQTTSPQWEDAYVLDTHFLPIS